VDEKNNARRIPLPTVFSTPIRQDIVQFVHANLSKNSRQPHGVDPKAGMKHSAESWGTGRAVARIPRVSGSGTHRAGQAAFGNMTRKGRMFAPLKTWRRWHRKVNLKQRRHAAAAALAASALLPLVLSRGHRVENIPELPLVVDDKLENYEKTKDAIAFLKRFGAYEDVAKVIKNKRLRAGKGKMRGRRYKLRKGPLVIYSHENVKLVKAFRNVPGIEVCNVNRLNLKQLAPGGQLGRFIIWTASAFKALDHIFGSYRKTGEEKKGYQLNRPLLSNADLARIINSDEVQNALRPVHKNRPFHEVQKKNPLRNRKALRNLNPNATLVKDAAKKANEENRKKRQEALQSNRGISRSLNKEQKAERKNRKAASKTWIRNVLKNLDETYQKDIKREDNIKKDIRGELHHHEEEQD
jgi:large subunit ribosomal protein L4e